MPSNPFINRIFSSLFVILFVNANNLRAEVDWASVVWHNDIFAGKDGGGYTNGLYVSLYDLSFEGEDTFKEPLINKPLKFAMPDTFDYEYKSLQFGQVMITPKDITKENPDPDDAPYAGVITVQSNYIRVRDNHADTTGVLLGLVGPSSRAKEAQEFIHSITGSDDPQGWDNQVGDTFTFMLSRTKAYRKPLFGDNSSKFDLLSIGKINAGTYETGIGATFLLRYGNHLGEAFSTAAIESGRMATPAAVRKGWYFYVGGSAEYLERSIFVDVNSGKQTTSGILNNSVNSVLAGFSYAWSGASITLTYRDGDSLDEALTTRTKLGAVTFAWRI